MLFLFGFVFLIKKRKGFLHPRFSFFTMFIGNEIFLGKFCAPSALFRFFLNFFIGSITFIVTTFCFSIGNRHTIRISNLFRGFYTIFTFILLLFLGCSTYIISSLGILLNP